MECFRVTEEHDQQVLNGPQISQELYTHPETLRVCFATCYKQEVCVYVFMCVDVLTISLAGRNMVAASECQYEHARDQHVSSWELVFLLAKPERQMARIGANHVITQDTSRFTNLSVR